MLLTPGNKIVFVGDSIMDCGRAQPIGEGLFGALGNGWISFVDGLLNVAHPEFHLRCVNMGCGGNTIRDLDARWQKDVLDLKPDWVTIMIGVNDVWRQFDMPTIPEAAVPLPEYTETLRKLVERTQPHVKGIVLMTPFFMEPNRRDAMRKTLDGYGDAVRALATEKNLPLADAQGAMDRLLEHFYSAAIGWDRVHPNTIGGMVLARTWLASVGVSL
jgi:lysophospholipase L1-like esterase